MSRFRIVLLAALAAAGVAYAANQAGGSRPVAARKTRHSLAVKCAPKAPGVCYYIDFASGKDSNGGKSESKPWQHAPGMTGCQQECATYKPKARDQIVFKGGVTWPREVFPIVPPAPGMIYTAVEAWHAGDTFTKPVFNADNETIVSASNRNSFVFAVGVENTTIENIAFEGFHAVNFTEAGNCDPLDFRHDHKGLVNKISFTNYRIDWVSEEKGGCTLIMGDAEAPDDVRVDHSYIDGGLVNHNTELKNFGIATALIDYAEGNTIRHTGGFFHPYGGGLGTSASTTVVNYANNYLEGCGWPKWNRELYENFPAEGYHVDMLQAGGSGGTGTYYIHGNVWNGSGGGCEASFLSNESTGANYYVWNNVYLNLYGQTPNLDQRGIPGTTSAYLWNNSIGGGRQACLGFTGGRAGAWKAIVWQNNLCVAHLDNKQGIGAGAHATTLTVNHNLVLAPKKATAEGFATSARYAYSPTSRRPPTVTAGENLTRLCVGLLSSLCRDTTYAGVRATKVRPSDAKWDIGAYQGTSRRKMATAKHRT
jgi:hypothetical protein